MLLLDDKAAPERRDHDHDVAAIYPGPVEDDGPDRQPDTTTRPVRRAYREVLVVLLILLLIGATLFAVWGKARHQLVLSFVRQPDRYTELYFSAAMPIQITPGQSDGEVVEGAGGGEQVVNVFFTVVNHEGQTMSFPYVLKVADVAGVPVGQAGGSVEVPDGTSSPVSVAVKISGNEPWSSVDVALVGRSEHIRYLREK
jgi:hypothetical protein